MTDPSGDPFSERTHNLRCWRTRLLGADFVVETDHAAVDRFVRRALEGLPRYRLKRRMPQLHLRILLRRRRGPRARGTPPSPRFAGGAGVVTANIDAENFAVLAPGLRSALLVLTDDMLRHAYHLRYELLEFAVVTLAVRVLGLVPLHAACLALRGRGLLIVGESGSGKSTLALQGAAHGLQLVSEDSLFVEPHGLRAASLPNYLYVRRGMPASLVPAGLGPRIAASGIIRRRSGVRKHALDLRRAGLAVADRAPRIVAMVLLTPRPARNRRLLQRLSAKRAVARLRATQAYAAERAEWGAFSRGVMRLPCFVLRRGDAPLDGVAALRSLLRDIE